MVMKVTPFSRGHIRLKSELSFSVPIIIYLFGLLYLNKTKKNMTGERYS